MGALTSRMIKCWCSCDAGYIARASRKHLSRWGAPLCPACGAGMQSDYAEAATASDGVVDFLADIHADLDPASRVKVLDNKYVKIRESRGCADCGRTHDKGFAMHYCASRVDGRIVRAWFCSEGCEAPVASEIPGGCPPASRIVAGEHETGRAGWSERVGYGEGFGSGARS